MFDWKRPRLFLLLLGLTLPVSGLVSAQEKKEEKPAEKAEEGEILGTLVLDVSPRTRVAAVGQFEDGLFRLGLWRHDVPIAPQVVASTLPVIVTFNTVPLGSSGVRLDLRLDPEVKAVAVVRSSSDTVEVHFSSHTFEGAKVRLLARRDLVNRDGIEYQKSDDALSKILAMQLIDPPDWVEWAPIIWPMGLGSPLRPSLRLEPEPHPFGQIPEEVRRGWNDSPILARAVELANQGRIVEASQAISGLPVSSDRARAMLALARGYVWSQPDGNGEPISPGRAGQAFGLAAGLQKEASWQAWARGQAAYNFSRALKLHDAIYNYELAIAAEPGSPDRPVWDVGAGLAMLEADRKEEGLTRLVNSIGGLPQTADGLRFTARRAVAHALWEEGELSRAARVVDLVLTESPALARNPRLDERWGRIYLDSGRPSAAISFFQRMENESLERVDRERARWWLHEVGLAQRDAVAARRWLRELIQKTPSTTLGPLAKIRLRVLDSVEVGGERVTGLTYQDVALALRNEALRWPNGPVEDEAISLAGQLFFELEMLEDGLHLYRWVEERSPSEGGAMAYSKIVCEKAPLAFDDLRARGHVLRAVGIFRAFLDTPAGRTCVDSEMRAAAAATAETAGLPAFATRWLGQAVATGGTTADDALNLIELSRLYLREGDLSSAEKTLRYIEATETAVPSGLVDEVWGDIHLAQGEFKRADKAYSSALKGVATSARHRSRDPRIRYQRGLARRNLGQNKEAAADLRTGLFKGGAPTETQAWLRLIEVELRQASKPADYEQILEHCDQAEKGPVDETSLRALKWYRSNALTRLGRDEEVAVLLQELAGGTDAWAVMAVEAQLDRRFTVEIDRLLSMPRP